MLTSGQSVNIESISDQTCWTKHWLQNVVPLNWYSFVDKSNRRASDYLWTYWASTWLWHKTLFYSSVHKHVCFLEVNKPLGVCLNRHLMLSVKTNCGFVGCKQPQQPKICLLPLHAAVAMWGQTQLLQNRSNSKENPHIHSFRAKISGNNSPRLNLPGIVLEVSEHNITSVCVHCTINMFLVRCDVDQNMWSSAEELQINTDFVFFSLEIVFSHRSEQQLWCRFLFFFVHKVFTAEIQSLPDCEKQKTNIELKQWRIILSGREEQLETWDNNYFKCPSFITSKSVIQVVCEDQSGSVVG